ncbi:MAG: restriction endonuclease subunit S [Nostoc sp.]|uniref:restriction endonuclease subunit S n=1 Tax=Nostoc sp. TaxID=1180 RepID=UPI002FFB80A3
MDEIQLPSHWKSAKLGEIAHITSGGTPSRNKLEYWNGDIPWVKTGEINYGIITSTEEKITYDGLNNSSTKIIPANTLLMAMYGQGVTRGRVAILGIDAAINQACAAIYINNGNTLTDFLFYSLYYSYEKIRNLGHGANQKNLNSALIKSIEVYLPTLPEQKTIAHTLRTIQKAKETHQRELELERERKAALMQYLFTHGTRNEPRKDKEIGGIPKSWIVSRFDSLCVLQRGFDITKKEQNPGKFPVISSGGISSYHNFAKVKGPGVIIGRKGTLGSVHYVDCDYWPHDTTLWVKQFNENNPLFIAYFLYFLNLKRFDSGASNPTLNRNTVHAMTIAYPKKEEQQEIAAILKACDRKIQALEKEIALTDELFHAMLEQLMTGKISTQPLTETYV